VNLECKVIGVPQPVLKWFKDGVELKPGDIHRIISGQDGACSLGTYTCVNSLNFFQSNYKLNIFSNFRKREIAWEL
jgi:Immunoglobulin I-set domain